MERPILFSGPMVEAILSGRKSQTRRVLKPQPRLFKIDEHGTPCQVGVIQVEGRGYNQLTLGSVIPSEPKLHSVGDLLWVRESWKAHCDFDGMKPSDIPPGSAIQYAADSPVSPWLSKGRPSIFMPRWASRITLRVTAVKVERLQEISSADAVAEGIAPLFTDHEKATSAVGSFSSLWASINGPDSWEANPWVAAYTFERIKP